MAKLIRVWDGSAWQTIGTALPYDYITINGNQVLLGGSTTIATGPTSSTVSSNITMEANNNYFVNTSAARTLTLPASASVGDTIAIYDASGTAATNNVTINSNSGKINGTVQNAVLDVNGGAMAFTYTGSTYGWRIG